jgi:DNA-binding transcriptional MerR regulator
MDNLITAGELAKLAYTTKRTIIWYSKLGLLEPVKIAPNGYRLYNESQVLEYQMILLMRTLGVSLTEIKSYLSKKGQLSGLFDEKKEEIKQEINSLQFKLNVVESCLNNINDNGTMVKPVVISNFKPLEIYYIEKTGPYSKIGQYCEELYNMFSKYGINWVTLTVFMDTGYQPKKCKMKIGVIANPSMMIKAEYKNTVNKMELTPGKVISYTHNGSGDLLSLFWKELEKYCRLHKIKVNYDIPDFEIYRSVNTDPSKQFFEIYLPIR